MTSHGESVDVGDAFGLLSRAGGIDHPWAQGGWLGQEDADEALELRGHVITRVITGEEPWEGLLEESLPRLVFAPGMIG